MRGTNQQANEGYDRSKIFGNELPVCLFTCISETGNTSVVNGRGVYTCSETRPRTVDSNLVLRKVNVSSLIDTQSRGKKNYIYIYILVLLTCIYIFICVFLVL